MTSGASDGLTALGGPRPQRSLSQRLLAASASTITPGGDTGAWSVLLPALALGVVVLAALELQRATAQVVGFVLLVLLVERSLPAAHARRWIAPSSVCARCLNTPRN